MAQNINNTDLSSLRINRDSQPSQGGSSWKKGAIIALLLCAAGAGAWSVLGNRPIPVKTLTVAITSGAAQDAVLTGQGYVVAQRKAAISSKATGRLEALYVIEGDKVKTGDIIGRIESSDVQASLAQQQAQIDVLKASLATAQAELEEAALVLKRQQTLNNSKAGIQAELEAAQARHKRALAQVQSAQAGILSQQATVRAAQVQVENTIIRAPFDGTVLSKNANVGEVITALGAAAGSRGAVVTLADMTSLEVEADVSESSIEKISVNQPVEISVSAIPDKKYKGIVNKIIPTADRGKGTVQVKLRFTDKDDRVLPEMAAKVNFLRAESVQTAEQPGKMLIPASAIIQDGAGKFVYVLSSDKTASKIAIRTGEKFGDYMEITQGISAGAEIILAPVDKLSQGQKVEKASE